MPLEFAYWPLRGLGNSVRLCLEYVGEEYNETRYKGMEEWQSVKFNLGFDFPNLPYLIDGQVKLSQSEAIIRYLAEKHDSLLHGKDIAERAKLEMLAYECVDFHKAISTDVYNPNFENLKEALHQKLVTKLEQVVKYLADKNFLGGDEPKYPDFHWYEVMVVATGMFPDLKEKFPTVIAYIQRFEDLPKIKAYMQSSKFIKDAFFGPHAKWGAWNLS